MQKLEEVKAYDRAAKERESTLQELEAKAAEYVQQVEHYQSVEQHLVELQRQHGQLSGERESLRADYADATFSNDFERIEAVHNQREDLDNRLADIFDQIEDTEAWLQANPLPTDAVAEVIAAEYMISKPSITEVLAALEAVHSEQASDLHSRRIKLSESLRAHVSDSDIEQARRRVSSEYRGDAERKERRREEYQAKQARYEKLPIRQQSKPGAFQNA